MSVLLYMLTCNFPEFDQKLSRLCFNWEEVPIIVLGGTEICW